MKKANYMTDEQIMNYPTSCAAIGILKRSRLTERHLTTDYTPGIHPEFDQAFEAMSTKLDAGGLVILAGTRGSGKTQMAAEYAKIAAKRLQGMRQDDTPILYRTAKELLGEIRMSMNETGRFAQQFSKCPLLIIDEVQVRTETEDQRDNLTLLIDKRYAEMRPTLIIGNLSPKELQTALGTSIMDRTRDGGAVLFCEWKSFRGS